MRRGGAHRDRGSRTVRGALAVWPLLWAVAGCSARSEEAAPFPELGAHAGDQVGALGFVAPAPFTADSLAELFQTEPTHCDFLGLGFCIPFTNIGERRMRLDVETVVRDVNVLTLHYRRSGFLGTRVMPGADVRGENEVAVEFIILRGDSVLVDSLVIAGAEAVLDTARLRDRLPLQEGDLFDTDDFLASGDTLLESLRRLGYANAEVLRNYAADTASDRATVGLGTK